MSETLMINGIPVDWKKTAKGVSVAIGLEPPTFVTISPAPESTNQLIDLVTEMIRHLKK